MASSTLIILISVNVKNLKNHFFQRIKLKEDSFVGVFWLTFYFVLLFCRVGPHNFLESVILNQAAREYCFSGPSARDL